MALHLCIVCCCFYVTLAGLSIETGTPRLTKPEIVTVWSYPGKACQPLFYTMVGDFPLKKMLLQFLQKRSIAQVQVQLPLGCTSPIFPST